MQKISPGEVDHRAINLETINLDWKAGMGPARTYGGRAAQPRIQCYWCERGFEPHRFTRQIHSSTVRESIATAFYGLQKNGATFLRYSRNSLILKYANYDAAIRSLVICRLVLLYLASLAHRAWGQHIGQRNMTLLQQDVCDVVGAIFAESSGLARSCRRPRRSLSPELHSR